MVKGRGGDGEAQRQEVGIMRCLEGKVKWQEVSRIPSIRVVDRVN